MQTLRGHILTPQGFLAGEMILGDDGRIAGIRGEPVPEAVARESAADLLLPGFVDLHVHGGGGRDIMEGGDAAAQVARVHGQHGTTALLATTMTAPAAEIAAAFAALAPAVGQRPQGGARILGVHLEGPYINPDRRGAQPDFACPADLTQIAALSAIAPICLITLAPEAPGNMDAIPALRAAGHRVQIGHTAGSYEEGVEALARGAAGFTHLFNAMSGLHHRQPGMVGAALAHARHAEVIPDLLHLHPGALRVAFRAIPCAHCVTDSTAAAGMPDGEYRLGRQTVHKCLGGVRLADGTLAGSTLTMDQALINLVRTLGMSLVEASARVSTHAADYLGLADRGRLKAGAWADVVSLDRDLRLRQVWVEGEVVK